jgi:hypothetical protein
MPGSIENAEHRGKRDQGQVADPLAMRLMLGTAEAYDGLEQNAERLAAPPANPQPSGGSAQQR